MQVPAPPYFDPSLDSWVLSRYRDVAAALRDPRLVPVSPRSTAPAAPLDSAVHAQFRADALRTLTPARLREWESQFAEAANRIAGALPLGSPVDLVAEYAKPCALAIAGIAADVPAERRDYLAGVARDIFEAACDPYDASLEAVSQRATLELARFFQGAPPIHMQMFIALTNSFAALLGNALSALIEHPAQAARLREQPDLLPSAMDELLRFAGLARVQFRQAVAEVSMDGCTIEAQQRVLLRLEVANRDPEHFAQPNELRLDRRPDHLALGTGLHACVAGMLIRSATAVTTKALLDHCGFAGQPVAVPVEGFAVRYLKSLTVVLEPALA